MGKTLGIFQSRRFWAAVGGVLAVVFQDAVGMTPEQAQTVVGIIMAWIVGDSLNKTGSVQLKKNE